MGINQPAAEPSAWWFALGGVLAGCLLSVAVERRAARALAHERRRVAADVHDLVMQDLSLALANARTLAHEHFANEHSADEQFGASRARLVASAGEQARLVVSAGERALAGARVLVSGLTAGPARECEPIVRAIQTSAQAAARSTPLLFDAAGVPGSARPDRPTREALVHIAREAVTNATKHASPNAIEVSLQYTGQWHLTVRNEGPGFDAAGSPNFDAAGSPNFDAAGSPNFGLESMHAQVQALGGVLHISSATEEGTTVKAVLP